LLRHLKKGSDLQLYSDEESSSKTLLDTKESSSSSSQPFPTTCTSMKLL
jgi:hypothetical protein